MEGTAKNSGRTGPSSSSTPQRKKTSKSNLSLQESSSNDNLCHQKQTAPATPPQVEPADLMTPPVAVVHTGKKKPRSLAKAAASNTERNNVISGSGGSGTTLTSATTEETCTVDEVSPMGSEGADESVPTSSPTNLEKILGMEEDIAPLPKTKKKGSKPPKTSRRSNKSSKSKNSAKSAAAKSALPFLLGYEQMVRTQDAEDWATAVHLRPIFAKLRYIGGDTTVAPTMPSSSEKNSGNALPTSIMGNSDASVTSNGTYGTTLTTATDRTDAEREADALSYLSSYSGQHVDKCDGTVLSFSAIAVSLSLLSSKKPNEEEITLDRSLMLLLQTIVEATAETEDIASSGGITFPEFLHGYKTITNAMQTIQRFPSTTTEGQHHKAQTRDRAHQMIQSFVRVPTMIQVPAAIDKPKDEVVGEAIDDSNIIKPVQEREVASTNPVKVALLHVIVALVCGTGASTMWANYVPPQNDMASPVDANAGDESEFVSFEPEEEEAEQEARQPSAFSQRSVEHFGLRREIRAIGARSKRWMKSAHKCQESFETLQNDYEEASLTIMELVDKNEEQPECILPEINNGEVVDVAVPADIVQSIDEIQPQKQKGHVKTHIVSAMGGAALTTLASNVLVEGSTKVISAAAASPLALAMGTARRQILSILGGATLSSLASKTLVEGTAKVVTGIAANSLAIARVVGAAVGSSPFALVMTVGTVALVIASVVENNKAGIGELVNA